MRGLIGLLGRTAMVAVVAILIAGGLAAPAEARQRDDGARDANDFIAWCISAYGDPVVTRADEHTIDVVCRLPDGTIINCMWGDGSLNGPWTEDCFSFRPTPGGLPTLDPGNLHPVELAEEATVVPPVAAAPADDQDESQVNEPKKKKKKQAKKGKKAKGKAKQRGKGRGGR